MSSKWKELRSHSSLWLTYLSSEITVLTQFTSLKNHICRYCIAYYKCITKAFITSTTRIHNPFRTGYWIVHQMVTDKLCTEHIMDSRQAWLSAVIFNQTLLYNTKCAHFSILCTSDSSMKKHSTMPHKARSFDIRPCLVPHVFLTTITSNVWTHAWSTKYRLFKKLKRQLEDNLRDESFKPN